MTYRVKVLNLWLLNALKRSVKKVGQEQIDYKKHTLCRRTNFRVVEDKKNLSSRSIIQKKMPQL